VREEVGIQARGLGIRADPAPLLARWVISLQAAICIVVLIVALWVSRDANPLRSDSPSYLFFDPSRTAGYPAFLWLIRALTGNVSLAVPVQMSLLTAALFLLGRNIYRLINRPGWSLLIQVFLVGSPELWRVSAAIMTEALATAIAALWCAQLLQAVKAPTLPAIRGLVAIAGVGMLVRPSLVGLFLGAGLAAMLLQSRRERGWAFVSVAVALALSWAITPAASLLVHGSPVTTSPLARGILQHTLFCPVGIAGQDPEAELVERNARVVRQYLDSAPPDTQRILKRYYSGELRFGLIIPDLGRREGLDAGWRTDPAIFRIARERVWANPLCYAKSVFESYFLMATYGHFKTPVDVAGTRAFLSDHPLVEIPKEPFLLRDHRELLEAEKELDVPHEAQGSALHLDRSNPRILIVAVRTLYSAAALAGFLALLALALGRTPTLEAWRATAGIASLGLAYHGVLAVTAVSELGLSRYTVPVWPIVGTMLALGVLIATVRSGARQTPAEADGRARA